MNGWQRFLGMVWWFPLVPVAVYIALFYLLSSLLLRVVYFFAPGLYTDYRPFAGQTSEFCQSVCAILLMWLIFRFVEKRSIRQSGFDIDTKKTCVDLAVGFACGIALVSSIVIFDLVCGVYKFGGFSHHFKPIPALTILFFAALTEEVVFRGFIFQTAEKRLGTWPAFALTCILFGLAHMLNEVHGEGAGQKLVGCVCLMLEAGIVLNAAFLVRRTFWLPLGLHWAWNYFEGPIYGMPVSGCSLDATLVLARLQGSDIVTGGYFGPEGSLPGVLMGTIAGVCMLAYALRRGQASNPHAAPLSPFRQ